MLRAQELDCVRYRGADEAILRRLAEAGEAQHRDHLPAGVGVVLRNVVPLSRSQTRTDDRAMPLVLLEESLRLREEPISPSLRCSHDAQLSSEDEEASFALAWFEDHFHPIAVRPVDSERWLILHRGNLGLSEFLDDWLRSAQRFTDLRWYPEDPLGSIRRGGSLFPGRARLSCPVALKEDGTRGAAWQVEN